MKNKLYIASAGAGKTTLFVEKAISCKESVLITTFTEENKEEIKKKFLKLNKGSIPSHVTIRTWFSFLIEHGAKPYQGKLTDKKINGLLLVNQKSGKKHTGGKHPIYYKEKEIDKHYFSSDLFKYIFIDEVQDMAGYDLEIIKLLLKSKSIIKMAGDPRQVTYHTHFSQKYRKYSNGKIADFIFAECKNLECDIDEKSLRGSWRNNQIICEFANSIFPEEPSFNSLAEENTKHDGVFLVKEKDVERYLQEYNPIQLRYSKSKKTNEKYMVKNFGESKGYTYNRVLLYPTKKITEWLFDNKELNTFETKCKFYVAITRARYSVAIVCKNNIKTNVLPFYK